MFGRDPKWLNSTNAIFGQPDFGPLLPDFGPELEFGPLVLAGSWDRCSIFEVPDFGRTGHFSISSKRAGVDVNRTTLYWGLLTIFVLAVLFSSYLLN